jgi:hypothetical protein
MKFIKTLLKQISGNVNSSLSDSATHMNPRQAMMVQNGHGAIHND